MRRSETIRAAISVETPGRNQNERRVPQRTPRPAADLVEQPHANKPRESTLSVDAKLVAAARREAGIEMTSLWKRKPTRKDSQVPLGARFAHPLSDTARDEAAREMRQDILPVTANSKR